MVVKLLASYFVGQNNAEMWLRISKRTRRKLLDAFLPHKVKNRECYHSTFGVIWSMTK